MIVALLLLAFAYITYVLFFSKNNALMKRIDEWAKENDDENTKL